MSQGDAFTGGGEERPLFRVAQGPHSQGVPRHEHVAARVEVHDVVCPVEPLAEPGKQLVQRRPLFARRLMRDQVQQNLGIGLEGQMHLGIFEDFVPQLRIVGQLPVEGEGKPLPLLDVPVFERLGVAAIFLAAGRVADVPDRGRAGVPPHDVLELAR